MMIRARPWAAPAAALAAACLLALPAGEARATATLTLCQLGSCSPATAAGLRVTALSGGPNVGSSDVVVDDFSTYLNLYTDFNPDLMGPASGSFEYTIEAINSGASLSSTTLSWTNVGPPDQPSSSITRSIYGAAGWGAGDLLTTLSTMGESYTFTSAYSQIWVRDSFTVPAGGGLDAMSGEYSAGVLAPVPAPLTVLGVGGALARARRLRGLSARLRAG